MQSSVFKTFNIDAQLVFLIFCDFFQVTVKASVCFSSDA